MRILLASDCKLIHGGVEFNSWVQSGAIFGFCAGAIWGLHGSISGSQFIFKLFEAPFYGLIGAGVGATLGCCAGILSPVIEQGWSYLPPIPVFSAVMPLLS